MNTRLRMLRLASTLITLALSGCALLFPPPPAADPNTDPPQGDGAPADTGVRARLVTGGLSAPVALDATRDGSGRLFIADQIGLIRVLNGAGQLLDTPLLDLRSAMVPLTTFFDERGLLGLALHPQFASNARFFVCYNAPLDGSAPSDFNSLLTISEFRISATDANVADASSERVLLRIAKPQFNHNGGQLAFGPDGMLYISVGDGGGANDQGLGHNDQIGNAQDLGTLLGKLLRIDVDSGDPYAIPSDNPFVSDAAARPEIYALGLRNAWRFSFDRGGARRLFVADVGQGLQEEVNIVQPGGNFGWRVREGSACFDPANSASPPANCPDVGPRGDPLVAPILTYPHSAASGVFGLAVVGGFFYRGSAVGALRERYVFADWSRGFVIGDGTLIVAQEGSDGAWSYRELSLLGPANGRIGRFILAFGEDAAGELYVLTSNALGPASGTGELYKLEPGP